MNDLILVNNEEVNGLVNTVNARNLHEFLESKRNFGDWINERIQHFDFIEGKDFITNLCKSTGGRPKKEYHLTLSMAKELSMLERNEKGKEARKYFNITG